jgi:hypothetical protein
MKSAIEMTTRQRWEEVLALYPQELFPEYRRGHNRQDTEIGIAVLAFEFESQRLLRHGKVLNISPKGVLLRIWEPINLQTMVLLRITLIQEQALLAGRVVHCTPTVGAFKVGILLTFDEEGK